MTTVIILTIHRRLPALRLQSGVASPLCFSLPGRITPFNQASAWKSQR